MTGLTQNLELKSKNYNSNLKADLKARTYKFSVDLIKSIGTLPNTISNNIISKQLIRSATSVGANIIEARASSSRRDFTNFYNYALKSANETKYWLCLLKDACGFANDKIDSLIKEIDEISKMLGSSIITLKKNKF